jgi:hypothetical protein
VTAPGDLFPVEVEAPELVGEPRRGTRAERVELAADLEDDHADSAPFRSRGASKRRASGHASALVTAEPFDHILLVDSGFLHWMVLPFAACGFAALWLSMRASGAGRLRIALVSPLLLFGLAKLGLRLYEPAPGCTSDCEVRGLWALAWLAGSAGAEVGVVGGLIASLVRRGMRGSSMR